MKKGVLIVLFFIGISTLSYSQSAGKGSSEKFGGGLFSRRHHSGQSPHKQMRHFSASKKDPYVKNNGTSWHKNDTERYVVDGNGYGSPTQGKRRKGKKVGVK